jgi:predicted amidophosphoribosyltransferase
VFLALGEVSQMENNLRPMRLECPGCGGSSFTTGPDNSLTCDYCHAVYVASGRLCPDCGAMHDASVHYCPSCGADLVRECRACGAQNPPAARKCTACGQDLGMLETLFTRVTGDVADWLREQRDQAPALKAQQEAASQARLAAMWAAEARRQEALAEAQAERDRQQRVMWIVAVVVLVIFAICILLAIVVNSVQSPHLYPQ